jgi:RimJ/RimL family protein N-acetyltransferase
MEILKWRNEQIYHLRQSKPLTEKDQENYFKTTVQELFNKEQPNQLLFSYLENQICIGYGGLVHINWIDKHAEISFVMNTALEKEHFSTHWKKFLSLIEEVAFSELKLHKLFTFAFDLRPQLYKPIEEAGYTKEAILKEHIFFNGKYKDVIIHSKFNTY